MIVSDKGKSIIKQYEQLRLISYLDTGGVPTVGWGTTRIEGEPVTLGMHISVDQAEEYFETDLQPCMDIINNNVEVMLTQNQFDALVSFCYNVGINAFKNSTMLKLLNEGDYQGAANQFDRWIMDNGRPQKGLIVRRNSEKQLFLA